MTKAALLVISCFALFKSSAQFDCTVRNFNTENGLPQNEITAMTMDYDGYLWLGTRSGLVRYDGSGFKTFRLDKNSKELYPNVVLYSMNIPSGKKTIVKSNNGNIYSIKSGRPVFFGDSVALRSDWTTFNGYFPSFDFFRQYYAANETNIVEPNWQGIYREIFTINDSCIIMGITGSNTLAYYKNGVRQLKIDIGMTLEKFLYSKNRYFFLDQQHQMYLYDRSADRFNKINTDWNIFKNTGTTPDQVRFFSDPFSDETFCFYNSTFYLLHFDDVKNLAAFIPQFSIEDKTHFWTGIVYDSLNSTFFLSTMNEGLFQVRLKKIKTFNIIERLPKNNISGESTISYAVLKTSDSTVAIPPGFQFTAGSSKTMIERLGYMYGDRETIGLLKDNIILVTQSSKMYYYSPDDGYRERKAYNDSFNNRSDGVAILMMYPEGDSVWVSTNNQFYCIKRNSIQLLFDKKIGKGGQYCELR
ncbi:MAG: two-component regulator propeller domain-containing protein [Bacteroidota bacterium]